MREPRSFKQRRGLTWLGTGFAALVLSTGAAMTEEGSIAIELNKLEAHESDCRAYFVIDNKKDTAFDALKLDLVLFRPDGIIGQRFAVELAPLKAKKRTVKLFDIADTACDEVGSFMVNEVLECKSESAEIGDCLEDIAVTSRTQNELTKWGASSTPAVLRWHAEEALQNCGSERVAGLCEASASALDIFQASRCEEARPCRDHFPR
jgi:hypothetical protein